MFNFPVSFPGSCKITGCKFEVSLKRFFLHTFTDLSKIEACGNTDAGSDLQYLYLMLTFVYLHACFLFVYLFKNYLITESCRHQLVQLICD